MFRRLIPALIALAALARPAAALEECRLMRMPDIQGDRIAFVYAGDLWTVARTGGAQWFAEFVAAFGLLVTILGAVKFKPDAVPTAPTPGVPSASPSGVSRP